MTDQPDFLAQFSNALSARAEAAKTAVVAIRLAHERHITGLLWHSGVVVASEQSLPRRDEYELSAPGGAVVTAKVAGRDPSTNIAILRPDAPIAVPSIGAGEARTGAIALAIGADGTGGASARLGLVNLAGPIEIGVRCLSHLGALSDWVVVPLLSEPYRLRSGKGRVRSLSRGGGTYVVHT